MKLVIVLGVHRGGTTLVRALLGAHPHIDAKSKDQLNVFNGEETGEVFACDGKWHEEDILNRWFEKHDFKDVYFVHIVRDPRAVHLSRKKIKKVKRFKGIWNDIEITSRDWIYNLLTCKDIEKKFGNNRYKQIRYEDLVSNPSEVCKDICSFINEEYDESMLDLTSRWKFKAARANSSFHDGEDVIYKSGIERWKRMLEIKEIFKIQEKCLFYMEKLGYEKYE